MCGSSTIVYRCQKLKDMAKPNKIERIDNKIWKHQQDQYQIIIGAGGDT